MCSFCRYWGSYRILRFSVTVVCILSLLQLGIIWSGTWSHIVTRLRFQFLNGDSLNTVLVQGKKKNGNSGPRHGWWQDGMKDPCGSTSMSHVVTSRSFPSVTMTDLPLSFRFGFRTLLDDSPSKTLGKNWHVTGKSGNRRAGCPLFVFNPKSVVLNKACSYVPSTVGCCDAKGLPILESWMFW